MKRRESIPGLGKITTKNQNQFARQSAAVFMSSYRSQSWLIDRRHVLCALGCCISLPMLECMIPLRATVSAAGWESGEPPLKLLFDTDIGADIDDEMTLIYLLNSPEIDLRGVTTVYGDPFSRAEFARGLIAAMGRGGKIPVHAGARVPMHEAPDERTDAVKFIVRSILQADGPRHLLLTGGHTNIGMALRENPALTERLVGIALMGFDFKSFRGAFNLDSDIDAAEAVLTSGIPLRVISREIGVACQLQQKEYNRLLASECPQMIFIRERMQRWVRHVRQRPRVPIPDYLPRPYDPLTAMTLTHPELFQWKRGTIELIDLTPVAGLRRVNTRFRESADGLHEIVVGVEREKAILLLLERLLTRPLSSRPPSDPEPSAGREQKG